ncbi:hypothetical protein STXM2123_2319 [Streptomyces sp. F-3]|nr:hypothetical protein STXM2123_2319 [Streptomyces sp. F-3]
MPLSPFGPSRCEAPHRRTGTPPRPVVPSPRRALRPARPPL